MATNVQIDEETPNLVVYVKTEERDYNFTFAPVPGTKNCFYLMASGCTNASEVDEILMRRKLQTAIDALKAKYVGIEFRVEREFVR